MSAQVFRLPDLGEGLTEAEVIEWKVAVGDVVDVDQVVVEVETAKASVEVPCPFAGRVETLHARAGEVLDVGVPLITVTADAGSGAAPTGSDAPGEGAPSSQAAEAYREEERAGSGNVLIGYGTSGDGPARRRRRPVRAAVSRQEAQPPADAQPADVLAAGEPAGAPTADVPATGRASGRATEGVAPLVINPIVRRLAREGGLDVADLPASGPGGVVLRRDVESALAQREAAAPSGGRTGDATRGADGETRVPLKGLRRAVADKLVTSRREIPDVSIWVDADATRLLEARAELKGQGVDVSLLALLARITVLGLRRFPELNARVDVERQEIVQLDAVHLGLAAQTDRGLVVPVVRDAHALSLPELSAAIASTVTAAREGTLPPADLTGGTFTLNNYGVFGVDGSTPIINHPEAGIVGVGRIVDKPWAVDGQLSLRKVTQLVLAFDHRVCDGGVAGGFLRFVADCVEHPVRLLAEV